MSKTWSGNGPVKSLCDDGSTVACTETYVHAGAHGLVWNAAATALNDSVAQHASAAGIVRSIYGQRGASGFVGGITKIGGGAGGTSGTNNAGDTQIDLGVTVTNNSAKASFLADGSSVVDIGRGVTTLHGSGIKISDPGNAAEITSTGALYLECGSGFAVYLATNSLVAYDQAFGGPWRTDTHAAAWVTTFAATCSSVTIKQADLTTNAGTGANLTIAAQNETGTTSTGGTLFLSPGTGTTKGGNVCIGATSFTANGMGTGVFIAAATAVPSAAPANGNYLLQTTPGNTKMVDTGGLTADINPYFKSDQTVAFVPVSVARYLRDGTAKFLTAKTDTVCTIESGIIPAGNCVGHAIVDVTALDTNTSGAAGAVTDYHASYRVGFKVVAGTLTVTGSSIVGTADDNTVGAVHATAAVTGVVSSGAVILKFTTLKTDPINVMFDAKIQIMRVT